MRNGYPHRVGISIHALLAESDLSTILTTTYLLISIHALLAESDVVDCGGFGAKIKFLSTLSLRRATARIRRRGADHPISIHALLAESDCASAPAGRGCSYFYPRSPCGERQHHFRDFQARLYFYPRSPCGERLCPVNVAQVLDDFYPRSPCGERQQSTRFWVVA